ncbi:unnamed protein product [Staurois parvus]|uniref:Uncharacterized protein n=1 Tax=Staurois parvus TaxID=386267 RepID=A0ABN9FM94_9NEOB|nr:unnamed protein product [Staurois parvus]
MFDVSETNCALYLVSLAGILHHHWSNGATLLVSLGGICPIIGVIGRNSVPSLVSVGGIVPHHWCHWGGIVPHHWCQWEE